MSTTSPSYAQEVLRYELDNLHARAGHYERAIADFRGKMEAAERDLGQARSVIVEMEAALKELETQ